MEFLHLHSVPMQMFPEHFPYTLQGRVSVKETWQNCLAWLTSSFSPSLLTRLVLRGPACPFTQKITELVYTEQIICRLHVNQRHCPTLAILCSTSNHDFCACILPPQIADIEY